MDAPRNNLLSAHHRILPLGAAEGPEVCDDQRVDNSARTGRGLLARVPVRDDGIPELHAGKVRPLRDGQPGDEQ